MHYPLPIVIKTVIITQTT